METTHLFNDAAPCMPVRGEGRQNFNQVLNLFRKFGNITSFEYINGRNFMIINYSSISDAIYAIEHYNMFALSLSKQEANQIFA